MNLEQIYKSLSLEQSYNLSIENKTASINAMSKYEYIELLKQNRHKVYRSWKCLWCGSLLTFNGWARRSKKGEEKGKDYCDQYCGKRYSYFKQKISGIFGPSSISSIESQIFIEYRLVEMLFRRPAEPLNEQLKIILRRERITPLQIIKEKSS